MLPKLLLISLLGFSSKIFAQKAHELGDPNTNINISEVDEKMGGHTISQYGSDIVMSDIMVIFRE